MAFCRPSSRKCVHSKMEMTAKWILFSLHICITTVKVQKKNWHRRNTYNDAIVLYAVQLLQISGWKMYYFVWIAIHEMHSFTAIYSLIIIFLVILNEWKKKFIPTALVFVKSLNKILFTSLFSPVRLLFWWCKDEMRWNKEDIAKCFLSFSFAHNFSLFFISFIRSYLSTTQKEDPSRKWMTWQSCMITSNIAQCEYCPFAHLKNISFDSFIHSKILISIQHQGISFIQRKEEREREWDERANIQMNSIHHALFDVRDNKNSIT